MSKNYGDAINMLTQALKLNRDNNEARFYRAISHLDSGNTKKCIIELNQILNHSPGFNKTIYLVLSIAYRRLNDINSALRTLSKGIIRHSKYTEAYLARGQIYIYQEKWEKAILDYKMIIKLMPDKGIGFLGKGDSLKGLGNYGGALTAFTKAIQKDQDVT